MWLYNRSLVLWKRKLIGTQTQGSRWVCPGAYWREQSSIGRLLRKDLHVGEVVWSMQLPSKILP